MNNISIQIADWANEHDRLCLRQIRETVFIKEQDVPIELEWDEFDEVAVHVMAIDKDIARSVGVARMFSQGSTITIGRMAVLAEKRNLGIGSALLSALLEQAPHFHGDNIELSAQTHALGFYEKSGFIVFGDEFLDAGIPHYHMRYAPTA